MRLKRLELFGFKSFADRTVMDFGHDLVGIVGPNGCGKSNVVDAVRWVLGEQRPTSMRGGEMTDVIFKGSASRPPLSVAEVSMVIDNQAGTLEGRDDEVVITRRVFRSGEGEYLIDGRRVRLKDVREMLFGTGLGSRGYSVLEQGKIDAILSANALERRAIFEEAAGVSRYRQRKRETESRLKRVEADLLRVDDVIGELARRERSLKIQAGRARRFIEARDAWRVDGLRLAQHQLFTHDGEIAELGRRLAELEAAVQATRQRRTEAEADVHTREREQVTLSDEVERQAARSAELSGELRALDERQTQLQSRIAAWREAAADENQRAAEMDERHDQRRNEAEAVGEEVQALEEASAEARTRVAVLANEAAELAAGYQQAGVDAEDRNEQVLQLLNALTTVGNRVQHLEESHDPLTARIHRAETRLSQASSEERAVRQEVAESTGALEEADAELARHELARDELLRTGDELETALGEAEARTSALEIEGARLTTRVEWLVDWERERERLDTGARELLGATEEGAGPSVTGRLGGILADLLEADTEWARAVDAALGARAQALVVEEPGDLRAILDWLAEGARARVALVLPAGLRHVLANTPSDDVLSADGVLGPLTAVVRPRSGSEELMKVLLGDVVRVRDGRCALELAARHPQLRFVTAEGDLYDAAGASCGHVEVDQGAVGRRATAAELDAERHRLEAELGGARSELEELRRRRRVTAEGLEALRAEIERVGEERAQAMGAVDAARARLDEVVRARELIVHEHAALKEELSNLEQELEAAREGRLLAQERYESERSALEGLEEQRRALEAERNQRVRDEGQARSEATGLHERLEALQRRRRDVEAACEELRGELERAARLAREHAVSADQGDLELEALAGERDTMLQERGELEERLVSLRGREREGRAVVEELRRRGDEIVQALEADLERVSETRLEKQRVEMARDEIARRAEEDFDRPARELLLSFEPEEELADAEAMAQLVERVTGLRAALDKLGPVNLEAVEELEEVSGRLGFLQGQRSDLAEARRSLEGTLNKLNTESERRFLETFEEVRTYFRETFRQLFGGGRADMELTPGMDVLEAGIEITARPPGRETLPISLLSGGQRTLTALAILFAVFRANSSPFCILDEVDAALDDANIGRFLSLITSALGDTQYVIVTHNKGTMAACQLLYGVTMAVRGVSHVVSVELDDVDEFVPEARGGNAESADEAPPIEPPGVLAENGRDGHEGSDDEPEVEPGVEPELREVALVPAEAPSSGSPAPSGT